MGCELGLHSHLSQGSQPGVSHRGPGTGGRRAEAKGGQELLADLLKRGSA